MPAARAGRPPRGARRWRRGQPAGALRSFEEGAGARFGAALGYLGRLLVFLLLERLLARGEDAADPEVEVVRARRRLPRRLVGDEAITEELEQALVEGLHPVLAVALRDGRRRSEEHTSELQSHSDLVCRLLLEKKKEKTTRTE